MHVSQTSFTGLDLTVEHFGTCEYDARLSTTKASVPPPLRALEYAWLEWPTDLATFAVLCFRYSPPNYAVLAMKQHGCSWELTYRSAKFHSRDITWRPWREFLDSPHPVVCAVNYSYGLSITPPAAAEECQTPCAYALA